MILSGALAAGVAINEVMGVQQQTADRLHRGRRLHRHRGRPDGAQPPVRHLLASLLFGALIQGGSALSFDMPNISREMVVVIQGLVILFTGALESMFRPALAQLAARTRISPAQAESA